MRPEQQATIPVKPHMHLSIRCNNNFKHLNVIIMMRMTCASFMQFLLKVDMSIKWSICHHGGNEKGCHDNVPVPRLRYRCKGEVCGCVQKMVGCSRIPGVPCVDDGDKEKEGQHAPTIRARSKHKHLIHHTTFDSRASSRWLYLPREHSRAVRVRRGSSCSRFVVVHTP